MFTPRNPVWNNISPLDLIPILTHIEGMETSHPPHQAVDLPTPLYYQLVNTLTGLLPPPLDDQPEALHAKKPYRHRQGGGAVAGQRE
jgi:hypothetical protein